MNTLSNEPLLPDEPVQERYAEYEAMYGDGSARPVPTVKAKRARAVTGRRRAELRAGLGEPRRGNEILFTFKAARFEEQWLIDYLRPFYDDQLITDVLREVKGGKEATVYCCAAHPRTGAELLAVKVYRPRKLRNLRNDAQYREGREVLDESGKELRKKREQRALAKKTRFGKDLSHTSWLAHEYETLARLHAAGADVPRPLAHTDNAILMEYVGDESEAAPPLHQVTLEAAEARPLFARLVRNIGTMLAQNRIHGDLSAYNVLYWGGEIRIIDFPQAVDPYLNPSAHRLLERDVTRVCQYFARYGLRADAPRLARQLWKEHVQAE